MLALATRLRTEGISAMIDQYQIAPPEGWPLWMERQIRDAKFVLLVCTETYLRRVMREEVPHKGLGVLWESAIAYSHLYDAGTANAKFIPVVFETDDTEFIPRPLRSTTYYNVSNAAGYELLYRRLTDQPAIPLAPLGTRRVLPPQQPSVPVPDYPVLALPPNLVHPYALQADFTGRANERRELTEWLEDKTYPVCAVVGMGGIGKSALTWYWLTRDVLPSFDTKLDGVMWWSFYEGESSFAKFIDEALRYVGGRPIDVERMPTTYDRALELSRELRNKRVLFVLDGFERQLRAYASLGATHLQEDINDESFEMRACVDPVAARWLSGTATAATRAKVLLTSRLMVRDLENPSGSAVRGVIKHPLKELTSDDAVAFMRAQGVTGARDDLAAASNTYGNHPLSLRLLSGLIGRDARTPGDIAAASRYDVHGDLVQRQHHIFEIAYHGLSLRERKLLRQVALIPNALTWDALKTLFGKDFRDEDELARVLSVLEKRGLYSADVTTGTYNMHIVLRRYLYDLSTDDDKAAVHVEEFFSPEPVESKPRRHLRAFLCHAREDKPAVRALYQRLSRDGIEPWLDEEDLLPGMDWEQEIPSRLLKNR